MKFKVSQEDHVTYLSITGDRLDSKLAPDLKSQFIMLANDPETGHLVVDLGTVTYADSSGLSSLLLAHRLYRDTERSLVLCNLSDRVVKLLEISQLTSVFNIAENRESAANIAGS